MRSHTLSRLVRAVTIATALNGVLPCHGAPVGATPTEEPSAATQRLRGELAEATTEKQQLELFVADYSEQAVRAPFGRYLLIRQGHTCVALRISEHTRPEIAAADNQVAYRYLGARYEWLAQPDGSMDFRRRNVRRGSGEVFEHGAGETISQTDIVAGPVHLVWSLADWIYFPRYRDDPVSMASTEWTTVGQIAAHDPYLHWETRGPNCNWGKAVNGLQLGAQVTSGKNAYHVGDWVYAEILMRNVSGRAIRLDYTTGIGLGHAPRVLDGQGHALPVSTPMYLFPVAPLQRTLAAGDRFLLTRSSLKLGTPKPGETAVALNDAAPGHYTLVYHYGFAAGRPGAWSGNLETAPVPLEITPG